MQQNACCKVTVAEATWSILAFLMPQRFDFFWMFDFVSILALDIGGQLVDDIDGPWA